METLVVDDFRVELNALINRHSKEKDSNTPDFILGQYLIRCLEAFAEAHNRSVTWSS